MVTADERTRKSTTIPWESSTVRVVLASTALAPLGVPLISPALPAIRNFFAISDAEASLLISVYFITGIVLSPFLGILADRVGRRVVLVPSLFIFSFSGGTLALSPDFGGLLAIRLVQGTAAAGIFITTVTLIGDAFDGVQRNTVLGVNTAVLSAGAAFYPLVGGVLVGYGWNVPFFAYLAGVPVAVFALVTLEEPETEHRPRSIAYLKGALSALVGRRTIAFYGTAFFTELLLFGSVLTVLPFLLTERFAVSPLFIGLVITVAEAVSVVIASQNGRFARVFSDGVLVTLGFACYGLGLFGIWIASSVIVVGLGVALIGGGVGLSMPSVDAAISGLVAPRFRAGALSVRNSTTFLGRAVGPVLFAGLAVSTGYRLLLFGAGVVAFAWGLVVFITTRG
ncbi:MFS transporter [Haladaptatus caseinilyticus]|uniref:MFS transporter n=1 Tax=Haladaptatus caseinilyticus TaxID=2993314 RepID=UPI00224AF301|nr:MFS transporter [Haladaptatus caseinilyticus]